MTACKKCKHEHLNGRVCGRFGCFCILKYKKPEVKK
jgi:hypothetical protein